MFRRWWGLAVKLNLRTRRLAFVQECKNKCQEEKQRTVWCERSRCCWTRWRCNTFFEILCLFLSDLEFAWNEVYIYNTRDFLGWFWTFMVHFEKHDSIHCFLRTSNQRVHPWCIHGTVRLHIWYKYHFHSLLFLLYDYIQGIFKSTIPFISPTIPSACW